MNDYEAVAHALTLDHKISEEEFRELLCNDDMRKVREVIMSFDVNKFIYVNATMFREYGIDVSSNDESYLEDLKKEFLNHCCVDTGSDKRGRTAFVYSNKKFSKVFDKITNTVEEINAIAKISDGNIINKRINVIVNGEPVLFRKGSIHIIISLDMFKFVGCRMGTKRVAFTDYYMLNDTARIAYMNYVSEYKSNKERLDNMAIINEKKDTNSRYSCILC